MLITCQISCTFPPLSSIAFTACLSPCQPALDFQWVCSIFRLRIRLTCEQVNWRQQTSTPQSLEEEVARAPKGAGHRCQQQVLHRQALITHPCLRTTGILLHGPPSSFWSPMPGLDHGHFSLEGRRMHLEMATAEPAGTEVSPALWIPENNK